MKQNRMKQAASKKPIKAAIEKLKGMSEVHRQRVIGAVLRAQSRGHAAMEKAAKKELEAIKKEEEKE